VSLRTQLANYGFESNTDYDFALRCLFDADIGHLRILHVDGRGGRRKTAFASALGHALEYPHILYHDFSRPAPAGPALPVQLDDGSLVAAEAPLPALDRVVSEACAYSEAQRTLLVLDQLQAADFADQLRLVGFASDGEWSAGSASLVANRRHLLLLLISEDSLYHSLARLSYRVWTDSEGAFIDFRPADFGLPPDAADLLNALAALFAALGTAPTSSEFARLLRDVLDRVRSEEQLRQAVFGWTEHVERSRLYAPDITPRLATVVDAIGAFHGLDHIEM
jgi:hypothetical protein